ncbi:dephospho-CoA kinase [Pedobacter nutrimenti]|uniref:dephospho-CoA kinase n=1 Tax=Pedobacter nutrimenti TaxID=1241337 RepID=UPI00292CD16F|nr:dephospho-CoA kinase [Pedobacter nutrimenti]
MLKIGITGGIGSGKTTICHIFETLGASVFYADDVAKQIMVTDPVLVAGVKETFGEESYQQNGVLNNKYIAGIVFNDAAQLAKLNALVHPAVFRVFDIWVAQVPETCPYILKEAALLFESGSYQMCDKNILVTAPVEVRMARVMARDQVTQAQVKARMDKQYTDEQKLKMADFFIINDESSSVIEQVLSLHHQFLQIKD